MADPDWHDTFQPGDKYARIGTRDSAGVVTWGDPFLIAGENGQQGDYYDYWFQRSTTAPATPAATDQNAELIAAGWFDTPPGGDDPLYMTTAKRGQDGTIIIPWENARLDGADAIFGSLTNDNHSVTTDQNGNGGDFSNAGGTFKISQGANDITTGNGIVYSVANETGVDVSINASTGVYTVNSMSADTGTATFRATFGSLVIDKVYTITKVKAAPTMQSQIFGPFLNQSSVSISNYDTNGGLLEFIISIVHNASGATNLIGQTQTYELRRDGSAVATITVVLNDFEPNGSNNDYFVNTGSRILSDQPGAGTYDYTIVNLGPLAGTMDQVNVTVKQYP